MDKCKKALVALLKLVKLPPDSKPTILRKLIILQNNIDNLKHFCWRDTFETVKKSVGSAISCMESDSFEFSPENVVACLSFIFLLDHNKYKEKSLLQSGDTEEITVYKPIHLSKTRAFYGNDFTSTLSHWLKEYKSVRYFEDSSLATSSKKEDIGQLTVENALLFHKETLQELSFSKPTVQNNNTTNNNDITEKSGLSIDYFLIWKGNKLECNEEIKYEKNDEFVVTMPNNEILKVNVCCWKICPALKVKKIQDVIPLLSKISVANFIKLFNSLLSNPRKRIGIVILDLKSNLATYVMVVNDGISDNTNPFGSTESNEKATGSNSTQSDTSKSFNNEKKDSEERKEENDESENTLVGGDEDSNMNDCDKYENLSELHTHLLGMGNAEFWIEKIIKDTIPKLVNVFRQEIGSDDIEMSADFFVNKIQEPNDLIFKGKTCSTEILEKVQVGDKNYVITCDVVYTTRSLEQAFDLTIGGTFSTLQNEAFLSKIFKQKPKNYIVFNKRDCKWMIKRGFTNTILMEKLNQNNGLLKSHLQKSFEMGNQHDFKGKFTPQFYPNRYILKDDIYHQYPQVLSILLAHTINNYFKEGVNYVEYSVSIKDLQNQNIREWLNPDKIKDYLKSEIELNNNFHYYFLGALNRTLVDIYPKDIKSDDAKYNHLLNTKREELIKNIFKEDSYKSSLDKLFTDKVYTDPAEAVTLLLNDLGIVNIKDTPQCGSFVGFDWVGDEKLYPFCIFVLDIFKQIAEEYKRRTGIPLGLRYHCGENVFIDDNTTLFTTHMEITYKSIDHILSFNTENNIIIKLRLGHGVAFCLHSNCNHDKIPEEIPTKMEENFAKLLRDQVCFELCPTSNQYLLYDFHNAGYIYFNYFHANNLVISTDNDGIMPIGGLKKEIKKILPMLEAPETLNTEKIYVTYDDLVKSGIKHRFISLDNNKKRKDRKFYQDPKNTKKIKNN